MMRKSGFKGAPGAAKLSVILLAAFFLFPAAASAILNIGDSVNKVKLTDGGGKSVAFPLEEKVLVVAFWHPKCEPCVEEIEKLSKNLKGKEGKGIGVVAVTRGKDDKEKSEAKETLEGIDKSFVSLYDPDFSVASKYFNVSSFPLFFIVDKAGKLRTSGISTAATPIRNLTLLDFVRLIRDGEPAPLIELVPKPNSKEYPAAELIGKQAPEIPTVKDMRGNSHSTEKYRGSKNMMIVFWSIKCPHCKRELPKLQSFYLSRARQFDVELLSITYAQDDYAQDDKTIDEIKSFVKDNQITFPVIFEEKGKLMDDFKVRGVPCVFIVSREGKIVEMLPGERDDIEQVLDSIFRSYPELLPAKKEDRKDSSR